MADLPKIASYINKLPYDAKTKAALTSAFSDPKPFEAIGGVGGGVSKQVKQAIFDLRGKAEMGEKYDLDDIFKSITTQPPPADKVKTVTAKTVEIRKSVKPAPAPEESAEEEEAPVEPPASVEPPTLASESLPSQPLILPANSKLKEAPFDSLTGQPLILPANSKLKEVPFASLIEPEGSLVDYQSAEALSKVSGLSYKDRNPSSETKAVAGRTTAPPPRPKAVEGRATDKKEEPKSLKKEVKSEDKKEEKKTSAPPATKQGGSYDGKGSNVYQAFELRDPPVNIKEVEGPGSLAKAFIDLPSNALNAWRAFTGGAARTAEQIVLGAAGLIPRQENLGVEGIPMPGVSPTLPRAGTQAEREKNREGTEKLIQLMPKPVPGAASDLFSALGSAVPFLLTGGPLGAATYGTLGAIEEARRRQDESGIKLTDAQEAGLILSAGIIGASEGLPFARLFRGMKAAGAVAKNVSAKDLISAIFPSLKTRVKSAGVQGFEEGIQELFAELGQNVIETTYGGRKPENLGDNLATAFKTGGEVGVILDFLTKALGTAVGRARFRRAGVNPGKVKEFLEQDPSREFKDAADAVSGFLGTQGEATVTETAAKPAAKAVTPAATPATKAKQESIIDLFEQDPENYYNQVLSDIDKAKADIEKLNNYKSASKSKVKLANDKLNSLLKKKSVIDDHITKNVKPSVDAGEVAAEPTITQPGEEAPAAPDTPAAPVVTEEPAAPAAATPAAETPLTPPPAAGQPAAPAPADKTTPATFSTPNGVTVKDITSAPPKDMMPDVDYEPGVDSIFEAEGVGTFVVFPDKSNPKVFNVLKKDGESSVAVEAASPQEAFEKFIDRPAPAIEVEAPVTATGVTEAPPGAVTPTSVTQPPPPVEAQPSPTLVAEPPSPAAPAPKPTTPSPAAPPAPTATEAPKPKDVKKEEISGEEVFGESSYPVWDDSKGETVNKKISITFKNSVDRDAHGSSDATFNKGQIGQEKAKAEAIIDAISKATGVTDRKKILEILSEYRSAVNSNVKEAALLDGGSSSATDAPSLTEFAKEVANPKKYQALSTEFYPYGVYNKGTEEKPSYAIGSMDKNGVVTSKWSDQKAESKSEADYYVSRMAREGAPAAPEPVTKAPPVTPIKPEVKPAEPTESDPPVSIKIEAPAPAPVGPASPAPTGAEPKQKSPPPDRRLFINRGSNDRVTVFFKDARDKSFFSAVAKYNGLNSNDKLSPADRAGIVENFKTEVSRIAKDLNISEQNARSILLNYHKAVKDLAQKSPKRSESEIIIEPFTIKEFAETLKSKTATSPSGPVLPSTPAAPAPVAPAAPTSVQPDAPVAVDAQPVATPEATPDNTSSESPKITTKYIEPKTPQYRKNGELMALKLRTNREPVLWVNDKTLKAIRLMLGLKNKKNFAIGGMYISDVDNAILHVSYRSLRSLNETEYNRMEEFKKQLEEIKSNSKSKGFSLIVVDSKLRPLVSPGSYEALKPIPRSKTAKKVSSLSDLLFSFRHENIHAETVSVIRQIPQSDANKISADPTFKKIQAVLFRKGYTEARTNAYLAIDEFTAHFLSGDYDYFVKNGMTPEELASAYTLVRPYILAVDKDSVLRAEQFKKPGLNIVESGPVKLSGGAVGNSGSSSNAIPGAMLSTAPIPRSSARSKVTPQEVDLVKDVVNATEGRRDIVNNAIEATSDRDKNLLDDIAERADGSIQDSSVLRKEGEEVVEGEEGIREMPTRIPNAKNSPIDDGTRINIVGLGSIAQDKRMLDTVIRKMTVDKSKAGEKIYHGLNGIDFIEGDPIGSSKQIMDRMVANLLWLHDKMPQAQRDRAKLWYDGASKLINTWSDQYKASPQAVSGVIAVLSPQKDWYQNAEMARKILEAYKGRSSLKWNPKMDEFFSSKEALVEGEEIEGSDDKGASLEDIIAKDERIKKSASKFYQAVNKIRGKDFNQLTSTYEKAVWLRANDEVTSDRSYRILLPEGKFGDISIIESGKNKGQRNKMAWQSYAAIEKAVDIMENPSYDNISDKLGTKHKVRNFYNNMLIPNSENGHVTIDTHAVAAALLQPLSANSTEVGHNFGGISSAATGSQGTYGLIAEAYRKAAFERGLLAREMQSITWEAVRGLFEAKFKSKESNQKTIKDIWDKLDSGEETDINKIREEIFEAAGGIKKPTWVDQGLRTAPPPKKK